jgi:N-acetylneuraminate synthase/sialic acid synthase
MIVSTGGGTLDDVRRAHDTIAEINPQVGLLQCTAGYPAEWHELDLRVIETYREVFPDTVVGYSGHDNGIAMPLAAYVLGGRIVEKHFTLNRALKGTDHRFSLEPVGLRKLVRDLQRTRPRARLEGQGPTPERGRPDHEDGQEDRRRVHAPGGPRPAPRGSRPQVARRRPPAVRARQCRRRVLRHPLSEDSEVTFEHLEELLPSEATLEPAGAHQRAENDV